MPYLPATLSQRLRQIDSNAPLEEIRIRAGAPVQLRFTGYERMLYGPAGGVAIEEDDCKEILQRLCNRSVYAWEKELGSGFVTLEGGYRVGLCGRMDALDGQTPRLSDVTGYNIRIAREALGAARGTMPYLLDLSGKLLSTLVVSPPGCGKTTLLRDIARCCSYGLYGAKPMRVAVVDSRYELSGSVRGVPQLDVGPRTDVLSGAQRAVGMRMMVTNLSPDLLVTDELASFEDARAVFDAICCGTVVAATAHAPGVEGLINRRPLAALLAQRLFQRIVLLGRSRGVGTVEAVFDASFHCVCKGQKPLEEVGTCCAGLLQ